jgi:hypothetical protein
VLPRGFAQLSHFFLGTLFSPLIICVSLTSLCCGFSLPFQYFC